MKSDIARLLDQLGSISSRRPSATAEKHLADEPTLAVLANSLRDEIRVLDEDISDELRGTGRITDDIVMMLDARCVALAKVAYLELRAGDSPPPPIPTSSSSDYETEHERRWAARPVSAVAAAATGFNPLWITAAVGIVSPIFALLGAKIAVDGAFRTQLHTQTEISKREREQRDYVERGVRDLFGARLEALQTVVRFGAAGLIKDSQISDEFQFVDALVGDTDRMLALSNEQRNAVIEAVTTLRLNIRNADGYLRRNPAPSDLSPDEVIKEMDRESCLIAGIYTPGFEALNRALESFGRAPLTVYGTGDTIAKMIAPRR